MAGGVVQLIRAGFRARRRIPAFACILLLSAAVLAGRAQAAIFDPESFRLSNGLQVVVLPNHRAPIVIQMVWYKVGSADEPRGKSGVAHFLEHLMFRGTAAVPPGEFSRIVARNGGRDNAFTSYDYTGYFQRVAADKLELVMRLEADRMANLAITDEAALPERQVVLEERRSRTGNDPAAQLREQSRAALYLHHPYGVPIIGWRHEIERLTAADAMAFYRERYAPNNAVLIVAGDATAARVRALAEKHYGVIPRRDAPARVRAAEPKHRAARRVELRSDQVRRPRWSRVFLAPSYNAGRTGDAYALQLLAELLGGGTTSRLYAALVVRDALAASAGAWYVPDRLDDGEFGVSVSPRPGVDPARVEAAALAEIDRLLADGVTAAEVERARRSLLAAAIYVRDGLGAGPRIFGRALAAGRTIADVEAWPDRIRAVTAAEVDAAARAALRAERSVTAVLLPEDPG